MKVCKFTSQIFNPLLLNRHFLYILALLLITIVIPLLFPRCANIVPPSGGPRDTIPPEVVRSLPPNFSTQFTGTGIHIEFDEFIQLRNINQQFIINPPQKERPDFRVRGRNLYVDLRTEPIPNTTYTLNFRGGIVDLNESNPLSNYEFVFSTGDILDSLNYSGLVLDAYTNKPVEGVVVMLYDNLNDSVPYLNIPLYANRTGKDGRFHLNNLRAETYLVFALTDVNNNYLYDRPGEESIAFLDDYLQPETYRTTDQLPATLPADTTELPAIDNRTTGPVPNGPDDPDINADTLQDLQLPDITTGMTVYNFMHGDTLFLFQEETGRQYISRNERPERGEMLFVFNQPLEGEWSIRPVNFEPPENWYIKERNPSNDSIRYWITDQETSNINQLRFVVTYWTTGPSDSLKQVSDSLNMNYTVPAATRRQTAQAEAPASFVPVFGIRSGGTQELNKNLRISFPVPISSMDQSKLNLMAVQNNLASAGNFELVQDSLRIRNFHLKTNWIPGQEYRILAEPGAFTSIYGQESDSIDFAFKTREDDFYGSILLNLTGVDSHIILQLLDEKDQVLREYFRNTDGVIEIDYLQPQNFRFKVIFDDNNNGKWDPGNYLEGIQPERVKIFRELTATRSNWAIQVKWDLSE
jgi:hypothetical protein